MKKITLSTPITVQPEVKLSEATIQRLVFVPEQQLWRIFCRELQGPIEVRAADPAYKNLPTFDEDVLAQIVVDGANAVASQPGAGRRLRPGASPNP